MIIELMKLFLLGAIWGLVWAAFMQFTTVGWLISTRQTWLGVVLGCSGNLFIAAWWLSDGDMAILLAIFAGSAVIVAMRSLHNQYKEISQIGSDVWQQLENSQEKPDSDEVQP